MNKMSDCNNRDYDNGYYDDEFDDDDFHDILILPDGTILYVD